MLTTQLPCQSAVLIRIIECTKPDGPISHEEVFHLAPQTVQCHECISVQQMQRESSVVTAESCEVELQFLEEPEVVQGHQKKAQGLAHAEAMGMDYSWAEMTCHCDQRKLQ